MSSAEKHAPQTEVVESLPPLVVSVYRQQRPISTCQLLHRSEAKCATYASQMRLIAAIRASRCCNACDCRCAADAAAASAADSRAFSRLFSSHSSVHLCGGALPLVHLRQLHPCCLQRLRRAHKRGVKLLCQRHGTITGK